MKGGVLIDNQTDCIVQIERLQKNLSVIRKVAKWTAEQLGAKIGVTKQTISSIEKGKSTMTKAQYISIRSAIDHELQTNKGNIALAQLVKTLLDSEEEEEDKEEREEYIKLKQEEIRKIIATETEGSIPEEKLDSISSKVLKTVGSSAVVVGGAVVIGAWLSKFLRNKE